MMFGVVFFTLVNQIVNASSLQFKNINVDDGLPNNAIRAIAQDKQGFVWIGTELGLTRYNGYSFKTFKANKHRSNTLSSSYVMSIQIDDNNSVWIGGDKGVSRYRPESGDFITIRHDPKNLNSLSSDSVTSMQMGQNGNVWIATDKGLDLYNEIKGKFFHYQYSPHDQYSLPSNSIRALFRSRDGVIWIGSSNGLAYYDPEKDRFNRIKLTEGKQPFVRSISENESGTLWIATLQGLFSYEVGNSLAKKIEFSQPVTRFYATLIDSDNNLWVGSSGYGLFKIDPEGNVSNFKKDKSNAKSIAGKTVISLFQGFSNMIWAGSYSSGVSFFSPRSLEFGAYDNSTNSLSCLLSPDVRSSIAISPQVLMLGTTNGLTELDLEKKTCQNYSVNSDSVNQLSNKEVFALHRDSHGYIWIGTQGGLEGFDYKRKQFKKYARANIKSAVLKIRQKDNNLVIGADDGLYKMNLTDQKITKISSNNKKINQIKIYTFDIDQQGIVWIASDAGLLVMDAKLNKYAKIKMLGIAPDEQVVRAVVIDDDNRIWLAIDGQGVLEYKRILKSFENLGEKTGLKNIEGLIGLYTDHYDNLWLATLSSGLFKSNKTRRQFTRYQVTDGLHSQSFNFRSFLNLPDGKILVGGKSGFNLFDPRKIRLNLTPPIVSITELKLFGKPVIAQKNYTGFKIEKNISDLQVLHLSHRESVFGLDFVATHYLSPETIEYAYKLDGFDRGWVLASSQNRGVTYNNIAPGSYVFRVKAKTKNGIWSKNDVALKIIINPAPWFTWWAYLAYVVSFIIAIFVYIRKRTKLLFMRAVELQQKVEQKTKELRSEKNKVEQLLLNKNEEFANVSHEFRTPLTLILGPVQQLQKMDVPDYVKSKMEVVKRNGYRLLRMVDQLLHLETFRVKSIVQREVQDFYNIIKFIADSFQELAQFEGVDLTIKKIDKIYFEFTPDALEKIMLNLLSNALKYTPKGGAILVNATRQKDNFVITVEDSGVGIAADKIDSIFERFQRIVNKQSESITGAGIGLSLVKSLVEFHSGRVLVESTPGVGTIFTVELPILGQVDSILHTYQSNQELISLELMGLMNQSNTEIFHQTVQMGHDKNRPTFLIVEDNHDMRNYIVDSLAHQYNCIAVSNGEEAMKKAAVEIPDIVISDIMMPVMDGYQLSSALRNQQNTSHIPIILLTARGDRQSRLKGWNNQIDDYLTKPFDVEELLIRAQNLLDIRQLLQKKFSESLFNQPNRLVENVPFRQVENDSFEDKFVSKLNQVLEPIYTESELKISTISGQMAMSQRQLLRKLKGVLNMTPVEYLRLYRLDKARESLIKGTPASNVAFDVGFSSHSHFGMCFKIQYGCPPSEYSNKVMP